MRTIVKAQHFIVSLWESPKEIEELDFRAMRYVLRIDYKEMSISLGDGFNSTYNGCLFMRL